MQETVELFLPSPSTSDPFSLQHSREKGRVLARLWASMGQQATKDFANTERRLSRLC